MKLENHVLYYKPTCPYCIKVLDYMQQADITMDMANTLEGDNASELIRLGGKKQVPCLIIDNTALYESDDIIKYLSSQANS